MRGTAVVGNSIPSSELRAKPPAAQGLHDAAAAQQRTNSTARLWRQISASKPYLAARSFAVFLGLWHLLSLWNANPIQLPTPLAVFSALRWLADDGELLENAEVSTVRLLISLAVTVAVAVPLGFVMGLSRRANAYIDPVIEMLRPISGIAWIPLGLFIFGVGDTLPVFIMVYTAFFPVLLNTIAGVRRVDRKLILAAQTMGLSRSAVIRMVIMPASLPLVMVGLRLGFAGAWTAIVAAELIGSPSGLGFAIEWYRQLLMSPKVFAYIMCIGFVGYVCDQGLQVAQRRLTPWVDGGRR
jgi:ABC-type nitrate/sulfonate/bicarbonate transport system permease component